MWKRFYLDSVLCEYNYESQSWKHHGIYLFKFIMNLMAIFVSITSILFKPINKLSAYY